MNKKFFFFDIDGTLAVGTPGRQYIPESTKKAIRMLKEQGHFVAIATGRSYAMAVDHMKELGFENMFQHYYSPQIFKRVCNSCQYVSPSGDSNQKNEQPINSLKS